MDHGANIPCVSLPLRSTCWIQVYGPVRGSLFTSDRHRELAFVGFLVCFLLILFLAAEAAIRAGVHNIFRPETPAQREDVALYLELERKAGVHVPEITTYRLRPQSTFRDANINELGFRGPDIESPKPKDRVRIAVLGNSTIFGLQLKEVETIPALTVAHLSTRNPACSFDYVSVSGPGYEHSDLMWLMKHTLDSAGLDHVIIVHAGPSKDAGGSKRFPFLEKSQVYWKLEKTVRKEMGWDAKHNIIARSKDVLERERSALEQIIQLAQDADIWYYNFYGVERHRKNNLQLLWADEAVETLSMYEQVAFSEALETVPPTTEYFSSNAHYTAKGAEMAAALIAESFFEVFPEQNALCE